MSAPHVYSTENNYKYTLIIEKLNIKECVTRKRLTISWQFYAFLYEVKIIDQNDQIV